MRKMILPLVNLIFAITIVHVAGQDIATLKVEGRGVEGRPPYRGGGVVKFLDVSMGAQILHFQAEQEVPLPLPLQITYDVLEECLCHSRRVSARNIGNSTTLAPKR